jgi:4'-phosphopantetheinyl transferase
VDVDGPTGPCVRLRGFHLVELGPLDEARRFAAPGAPRPSVLTEPEGPPEVADSPELAYGNAEAGDDAAPWLTDAELAALAARGTERRFRDRVAGRIAAKRALTDLLGVKASAIRLDAAPSGEPVVSVSDGQAARVSISHIDGHAVAAATRNGRVGIDLERVVERDPSFAETWLREEERALCVGDPRRETAIWCVKEAVLKALGTGMAIHPRDVVIVVLGDDDAWVELHGEAADRHADLGGAPLRITWSEPSPDEVLALVRMDGGDDPP